MITRETVVEVLEKSTDLIFISLCSREDNYGFTEVERGRVADSSSQERNLRRFLVGILGRRNPIADVCAYGHLATY
jgi:hypothetical protein